MEIIHDAPIPTNSPRDATGSASASRISNAVADTQKTYDVVGEASLQSFSASDPPAWIPIALTPSCGHGDARHV